VVRNEPKIILFDIETLPDLKEVMKVIPQIGAYPGLTLKATLNSVICFGYKVFAEDDKPKCINAWDFKPWAKDVNNDYEIVKAAREILSEADAVVTHNGRRFDWKFLQTRLIYHKLPPLPKIPHIDTCALAKSNLFLFNNRLNTLAKFLTSEEKMENGGWDLWFKVLNRDPKSMRIMTDYCKQDVNVLEKVFKVLRPFCTQIPNYNLFGGHKKNVCPSCGSSRLRGLGWRYTKTTSYRRFICLDCSSFSRTDISEKLPRSI
jgi:DNA polymerase elongation subunit (family B)